jgi:hypothetical protein
LIFRVSIIDLFWKCVENSQIWKIHFFVKFTIFQKFTPKSQKM